MFDNEVVPFVRCDINDDSLDIEIMHTIYCDQVFNASPNYNGFEGAGDGG
jgi:hypothetical protein